MMQTKAAKPRQHPFERKGRKGFEMHEVEWLPENKNINVFLVLPLRLCEVYLFLKKYLESIFRN